MGESGIDLSLPDDCGWGTMGLSERRVAVPAQVARSLSSWFPKAGMRVPCVAIAPEVGRIVVVPQEVANTDDFVRGLILGRRGPYPDLASALHPQGQELPEIVRRLRVTQASIDHPASTHRLHLSRELFPLLDLDKEERRLYLYSVDEHLEVVSVAFVKQGFANAPLEPPES